MRIVCAQVPTVSLEKKTYGPRGQGRFRIPTNITLPRDIRHPGLRMAKKLDGSLSAYLERLLRRDLAKEERSKGAVRA